MIIGHTICTLYALQPVGDIAIIVSMKVGDFLEYFTTILVGYNILYQKCVGMSHSHWIFKYIILLLSACFLNSILNN